jgi:hypothetical protein
MAKQGKRNGRGRPEEKLSLLVGGKKLEKDDNEGLDGGGNYQIVNPLCLYLGKSYSDWTADWFNWFLSSDADKRNSGPVVFLRSRGLPNSITRANISDVPGQITIGTNTSIDSSSANIDEYMRIYINDPNIRIGSDRLQIFEDQAVFVPIIVAYAITSPNQLYQDWGRMQDFTGLTIDYGDDPPQTYQLTINNEEIAVPFGLESKGPDPIGFGSEPRGPGFEMKPFRITTPIFTAIVPETEYGRSIKDFLEDSPILPGIYPAQVDGYFVMLRFAPGTYWIHSWASAPRERNGPYFSELLYQVEVVRKRPNNVPHRGLITEGLSPKRNPGSYILPGSEDPKAILRPSRNERVFNRTLSKKKELGDLTEPEIRRFQKFFSSSLPSPTFFSSSLPSQTRKSRTRKRNVVQPEKAELEKRKV